MTLFSGLDTTFSTVEKTFNFFGYFPIVGSFSAIGRIGFAKAQVITALALASVNFLASLFVFNPHRQRDYEARTIKSLEYAIHGFLNMNRAVLEFIPILPLVTCLPYDLIGCKFRYTSYQAPTLNLYLAPIQYHYVPIQYSVSNPSPYNPESYGYYQPIGQQFVYH